MKILINRRSILLYSRKQESVEAMKLLWLGLGENELFCGNFVDFFCFRENLLFSHKRKFSRKLEKAFSLQP
jgi:hypothetical protein